MSIFKVTPDAVRKLDDVQLLTLIRIAKPLAYAKTRFWEKALVLLLEEQERRARVH